MTRTIACDLEKGVVTLDAAPDWIISDTHFGHDNIIRYCRWRTTWAYSCDEHDSKLISEWNRIVGPSDVVLHLGDFALCREERLIAIRLSLRGRIILVRGNHDGASSAMRRCHMDWVGSRAVVHDNGRSWLCGHDPDLFTLADARRYAGLLHGHCHGNGYRKTTPAEVTNIARDCSLDALQSIAPVSWHSVVSQSEDT